MNLPRFLIMSGLISLFLFNNLSGQVIKRGRNEGTINIPASNVEGNGNIILSSGIQGYYGNENFGVDPGIFVKVGIAEILQLSGRVSFINFSKLGSTEAHLQLTMPGNNHLRFFGAAVSGDLYLSTTMDTLSGDAVANRPDYHSYIRPSLIFDLDFISLFKQFPVKMYYSMGMADNPDLIYKYDQLSFKSGIEWKLLSNSFFSDIGYGIYKEKRLRNFPGDPSYLQQTLWVEPGARYRFFGKYSLLGSVRVLLYQRVKKENPLAADYIKLSTAFEMPIIYRETNTEVIRTLVFVEKQKEKKKDLVARNIEQGKRLKTDFEMSIDSIGNAGISEEENEKEAVQKREDVQQKMDEIETLLEELENDNQ